MNTFYAIYNFIILQLFGYRGQVDRLVLLSFIYTLAAFILLKVWKNIGGWVVGLENIMNQFNDHLEKRDKIIKEIRENFIFEKIKSGFFSIQYFRINGAEDQIEIVKNDLRNFGINEQLINDDKKLYQFLNDLQQKKYTIIVDTKNHKFIFVRKEQQDENE